MRLDLLLTYKPKYDTNGKTTDKYAKKTDGYGARVAHVEDDPGSNGGR